MTKRIILLHSSCTFHKYGLIFDWEKKIFFQVWSFLGLQSNKKSLYSIQGWVYLNSEHWYTLKYSITNEFYFWEVIYFSTDLTAKYGKYTINRAWKNPRLFLSWSHICNLNSQKEKKLL